MMSMALALLTFWFGLNVAFLVLRFYVTSNRNAVSAGGEFEVRLCTISTSSATAQPGDFPTPKNTFMRLTCSRKTTEPRLAAPIPHNPPAALTSASNTRP